MYVDLLVVTDGAPVPGWLLPCWAPFELVAVLHKLNPGFTNGCTQIETNGKKIKINGMPFNPESLYYERMEA